MNKTNITPKPKLLTVAEAKALDLPRMTELFTAHLNPGQLHFMKLLGFHKVKIERAEGMYYYDQNGRPILDFSVVSDRWLSAIIIYVFSKHGVSFRKKCATRLQSPSCRNMRPLLLMTLRLARRAISTWCFWGLPVLRRWKPRSRSQSAAGPKKPKIVYAENSFHGKTKGVLSITDGGLYRGEFKLVDNTVRVPFGDIAAIENAFRSDPEIGVIVLETVQGGGGIIQADAQFWQKLRNLCDQYGVIWVADEVQCGLGRTGKFYAFEHYGVIPDVTALAKSLGGGKTAMAAMIARRDVYMKAYGTPKTAMIHAMATFGGIGEACVTSIEALNVLYDEHLIDNAADVGEYLLDRLHELQSRYPALLKDVRGKGMMVGLEFHDFSQTMPVVLRPVLAMLDEKLKGSLPGFIGSHLLRDHGVLVAFTEYNRNVIRLEPPLICGREHVDAFIKALDEVLSRGIVRIVRDFVKAQIK